MPGPDGSVMHAELQVGTSRLMLAEENPEMGTKSTESVGGSPVSVSSTRRTWMRSSAGRGRRGHGDHAGGRPVWGDRMGP